MVINSAGRDVVDLAVDLMTLDSTTGAEAGVIDLAEQIFTTSSWTTERIPVSAGRSNLLAYPGRYPSLILSTHVDTVPPWIPPRINGSRLEGRGACDAKGIMAAMMCAAFGMARSNPDVGVLLLVGEEGPHDGARAANAVLPFGQVLINGEPTGSTLAVACKGTLHCTLHVSGKAAHSAFPEQGVSATGGLVHLLAELDTLPLPVHPTLGQATINIGSLSGGIADNVVAPAAHARLLVRLVTSADEMIAILRSWIGDRAEIIVETIVPPVLLDSVDGFPTTIVPFSTDVPYLTKWRTRCLFGPGNILSAHTDEEYIEMAELRAAVDAYRRLAEQAMRMRSGQ